MSYFVTGGTGFIGRYLIDKLLARKGTIHVLVRKESQKKFAALAKKQGWDPKRVVAVTGDMTAPRCGLTAAQLRSLGGGKIKHFFHLAAVYDMTADAESQRLANVDGTRNALDLAAALKVGCFHHTSSIAAAGMYPGVFREDMFEEAEGLDNPYLRTKHESEGLVRAEKRVKWRIYRPGMVVGHSQTGEIDKIDGPYYFFTFLKKLREMLPPWMPVLGVEGGRINIVPVDFVAAAMDHIAHKPKLDGHCFHLTDPDPLRAGEVINLFARAGPAPKSMSVWLDIIRQIVNALSHSSMPGLTFRYSWRCQTATYFSRSTAARLSMDSNSSMSAKGKHRRALLGLVLSTRTPAFVSTGSMASSVGMKRSLCWPGIGGSW